MTIRYLGTWHGALLLRRGSAYFQQSDDGALGPRWREFRITKKVAEEIMRLERVEGDMVFGMNDANIPRSSTLRSGARTPWNISLGIATTILRPGPSGLPRRCRS